jgi:hypothetical protein
MAPPRLSTPEDGEIPLPTTPYTSRALEKVASILKQVTPNKKKAVEEKFVKGALVQAKKAVEITKELSKNTAAEKERKARRLQTGRQLQKGGVLYAAEARELKRQRDEEGGTQLDRTLRREAQLKKDLNALQERHELLRKRFNGFIENKL